MDHGAMAEVKKKIVFQQTLHGYEEGHSLLASSCELNNQEKRMLSLMSDYSGSGIESNFSTYLTGYPLPNSKYYAFARTWYASEMSRPGCVWTHTLLIDIAYLGQLKSLEWLNSIFQRPIVNKYSLYSNSLQIDQAKDKETTFLYTDEYYALAYTLYDKYEKSILIPSQSAQEYEPLILQLWTQQWPRLRRNFSFCTGSLALRTIQNKHMDLQIIPLKRLNSFNRKESENTFILFLDTTFIHTEPRFKELKISHYENIVQFMKKYGFDIDGTREKYLPLLHAYEALEQDQKTLSVEGLLTFFTESFPDSEEAKALKKTVIEKMLLKSENDVLKYLISSNSKSFDSIEINLLTLLFSAWNNKAFSRPGLISIIQLLKEKKRYQILSDFLSLLPFDTWLDFDVITSDMLSNELAYRISSEYIPQILKNDKSIQDRWFSILISHPGAAWNIILEFLIKDSRTRWVSLFLISKKEDGLNIILETIKKIDKLPPEESFDLIKENYATLFKWMAQQNSLNQSILQLIIRLFSPTEEQLIKIDLKTWKSLIKTSLKSSVEPERTGFFTFITTACFAKKIEGIEEILPAVFQPLHDSLKTGEVEKNTWNRFSYLMGNELYYLWEREFPVKWFFKIKFDVVPEWDKCEFLRRSLVCSFISNQWKIGVLFETIKDKETFEHVVAFATSMKSGNKLIKKAKEYLQETNNNKYSPFLNIIINHLD